MPLRLDAASDPSPAQTVQEQSGPLKSGARREQVWRQRARHGVLAPLGGASQSHSTQRITKEEDARDLLLL